MPFAQLKTAEIHYEVLGRQGRPWVVLITGGRNPGDSIKNLAIVLVACGYRVLLHDRRNCGRSSLAFDPSRSEEDVWADDLQMLMDLLGVERPFIVGKSRGARVAIRLALQHPDSARGMLLWGVTGGPVAARWFDDRYFGRHLRACAAEGMAGVCATDHFSALIEARPANREELLTMDPTFFTTVWGRGRNDLRVGEDSPVLGVTDEDLRRIRVPTEIVPIYNRLHPVASCQHANSLIPTSRLHDFDPRRHSERRMIGGENSFDTITVARVLCATDSRRPISAAHQAAVLRVLHTRKRLRLRQRLTRRSGGTRSSAAG